MAWHKDLPGGGPRVGALIELAISADDDVTVADAVDDLLLAAASLMLAVWTQTEGAAPMCPPMSGRPEIDAARQAVSELAESMAGKMPERPS